MIKKDRLILKKDFINYIIKIKIIQSLLYSGHIIFYGDKLINITKYYMVYKNPLIIYKEYILILML
jgi:hypothetical protein